MGPEALLSLLVLVALGLLGRAFLDHIFMDVEDRDGRSQFIFCVMFSLSVNLIVLLVCEVLGLFGHDFRLVSWRLTVLSISLMLLVLLPLYQVYRVLRQRGFRHSTALATALVTLSIFHYIFWSISLPGVPAVHMLHLTMHDVVSRIGFLGVTLLAVLTGYGSVLYAQSCLSVLIRHVDDFELEAMKHQLHQSLEQILARRRRIALLYNKVSHEQQGASSSGMWGALTNLWGASSSHAAEMDRLAKEASSMELLTKTLYIEFQEMNKERDRALNAKTWRGHVDNLLGYLMGLYCLYRILFALVMLVVPRLSAASDPVSGWVSLAVHALSGGHISVNERVMGQVVTLLFVGIISGSSLRSLLLDLFRFFSAVSGAGNVGALLLVFSYVMALYVLSSIVLIRQRLPAEYRAAVTEALGGGVDNVFDALTRWFNVMYALSVVLATCLLYTVRRARHESVKSARD